MQYDSYGLFALMKIIKDILILSITLLVWLGHMVLSAEDNM